MCCHLPQGTFQPQELSPGTSDFLRNYVLFNHRIEGFSLLLWVFDLSLEMPRWLDSTFQVSKNYGGRVFNLSDWSGIYSVSISTVVLNGITHSSWCYNSQKPSSTTLITELHFCQLLVLQFKE